MITIRLFGGAKKAIGKPTVEFDKPNASIAEILQFLTDISSEPHLLQPNNLIVAVNGIDSAALQGQNTMTKSGDTITVVTVVHGGVNYTIDDKYLSIIGVQKLEENAGKFVERLRAENKDVLIQVVNADVVYGTGHVLGVLRMMLEAKNRETMIANKHEIDLLMRLACTRQISEAMNRAGLKKNTPCCFIALSKDNDALCRFSDRISNEFKIDDSVIEPDNEKKNYLANILGINVKFNDDEFLLCLLERAAILVK